jgi:hypothetical protein
MSRTSFGQRVGRPVVVRALGVVLCCLAVVVLCAGCPSDGETATSVADRDSAGRTSGDGRSSDGAGAGATAADQAPPAQGDGPATSAGPVQPVDVEPWPDPPSTANGVAQLVRWEHMYAQMGMSPEWAARRPEGEDGWETPGLLKQFLDGPMAGVEEVVFAIRRAGSDWHWYANFGYVASSADRYIHGMGGQLCKMNLRTGEVTVLLDDPAGDVRDPAVSYDGQRIVFSYRPGDETGYHLFTIGADGSGLTRITDGEYDDIEPCWLPSGEIMFCSSRCKRWVPCWHTQVAIIYRCNADGSDVRLVSANVETDNTPWPMPDGRVLYTRWEYVDRSQDLSFHHLWTFNPDGTGVMTYYGNQFAGMLLIDAKPIPGTEKVVCSACPGHGRNEHAGAVAIISPDHGPDHLPATRIVSRPEPDRPRYGWHKDEHRWRDPWAFSEHCFLVARERSLAVMDGQGRYQTLYTLSEDDWPIVGGNSQYMIHEPRPIAPRPREPVVPDRVDPASRTGTLVLSDVHVGRKMDGVEPGEITDLLVLEMLPKPINYFGGQDQISMWPTYFIYRILGTVPVEPDGSAHFHVPALRPVFFVALDANGLAVKRMQSFTAAMPGETLSCVGCHEHRTQTPRNPRSGTLAALRRNPSHPTPVPDVPEIIDFNRDVQPLLNKHCVRCHDVENYKGQIDLTADRGLGYSHAFVNLHRSKQVVVHSAVGNHPPRTLGSSASPLLKKFSGNHHGVRASAAERRLLRTWIDAAAPYAGTYACLGTGMITYRKPVEEVFKNRCDECHASEPSRRDKTGRRWFFADHRFNLTRPAKSLMLLAPLAKEAGGLGLCRQRSAVKKRDPNAPEAPQATIFTSTDDPHYQMLLASLRDLADWWRDDITSFELDTFVPQYGYIRELKRYGVLPETYEHGKDPVRPFEFDEAYWRSLQHKPKPATARTP